MQFDGAIPRTNGALSGERPGVPFRLSLRFRLSLIITLLIAAVLVAFLWAVNREVRRAVLANGSDRAMAAATQVAAMLAQNTSRGFAELQRRATEPGFSDFLASPSDTLRARLEQRLKPLAAPGQPPLAVLSADGTRLLEVRNERSAAGPATELPLVSGKPSHTGAGEFQAAGGTIYSDVVAEIRTPGDESSGEAGDVVGYLVLRRVIQAGPNPEMAGRLIGSGATLAIGNRSGTLWTDFMHQISAPPVDARRSGHASFSRAGSTTIGGVALVDGTPWAVWIGLPERVLLAPAQAALGRMVLLALACIVLAGVAVAWISARVSRPILDLTAASEAIAAGEYSQRVATDRRDEIGRLGAAFNTMTNRVAEAHHDLEARVEQRTIRLEETRALLENQVREFTLVNQELEAFTYSVSHDLRAPLRRITGFAGLLERSAASRLDAEQTRHLEAIAGEAGRMERLIDDLLAFSRNGRAALAFQRVRLDAVVCHALEDVRPQSAHVDWSVRALPEVQGDPAMLRQVFANLLDNAAKYTRGRPGAQVEIDTVAGQPDEAIVYVRDNGVGFDMQYVDKLFGVFQRLHDCAQFEGTGIGLANVRRIVHRHGGRTWAEGQVNGGATFYVSLPRA